MQTAPGIPRPFARTDKSAPRQGHSYYRDNATGKQVTLRRVAPRLANPPLVPERQSFRRKNGPGGTRTLARTLTGSCAAITPQAHARSLRQHRAFATGRRGKLSCRVSIRERRFRRLTKCKRPRNFQGRRPNR